MTFRAGRVLHATMQPAESKRFPLAAPGRQRLLLVQGTEARTLHATVIAIFAHSRSYCFRYFPPRLRLDVRRT